MKYDIKTYTNDVINNIDNIAKKSPYHLQDIINTYASGGKYIRAKLTLLFAVINDIPVQDAIDFATSVELIHTASLLHDDVIDNNEVRRNKDSAPKIWGNNQTILAGNHIIFEAINTLTNYNMHAIKQAMLCIQQMIEGEAQQECYQGNTDITFDICKEINLKKTASAFMLSASIHSMQSPFVSVGEAIGLIFQLKDDIQDCVSETTGKALFQDIYEKKMTIPVLVICKNNNIIAKYLESDDTTIPDIQINDMLQILISNRDHIIQSVSHEYETAKKILHTELSHSDTERAHYITAIIDIMDDQILQIKNII